MAQALQSDRPMAQPDDALHHALLQLAPSWQARGDEAFSETIITPANDILRHLVPHWPEKVGPTDSLIILLQHIADALETIVRPEMHLGLVLANGPARNYAEHAPFMAYDLSNGSTLAADDDWQTNDPALLFVDATILSEEEFRTYLRLMEQAKDQPFTENVLDALTKELVVWQKELAFMKASLQASLMQGGDPLALGSMLSGLKALITQGKTLAAVTAQAKAKPKNAQNHTEVRKHVAAFRARIESLAHNDKLPRDMQARLSGMLVRLQKITNRPSAPFAKFLASIRTKIADGKQLLPSRLSAPKMVIPSVKAISPASNGALSKTAMNAPAKPPKALQAKAPTRQQGPVIRVASVQQRLTMPMIFREAAKPFFFVASKHVQIQTRPAVHVAPRLEARTLEGQSVVSDRTTDQPRLAIFVITEQTQPKQANVTPQAHIISQPIEVKSTVPEHLIPSSQIKVEIAQRPTEPGKAPVHTSTQQEAKTPEGQKTSQAEAATTTTPTIEKPALAEALFAEQKIS